MKTRIWGVTLLGVFVYPVSGEDAKLIWAPKYQAVHCRGALTINVTVSDPARDLFVGLEAAPDRNATVELAVATILPFVERFSRFGPQGDIVFNDHSGRIARSGACKLTLPPVAEEGEHLAIHVRGPSSQRIVVIANGRQAFAASVGRGAIFHDGRVLLETGNGQLGPLQIVSYAAVLPATPVLPKVTK